ncbi:putative GIY-YIG superfamily endonuclease [Nitrobacteraceae bacterium AZCC 2161]
MTPQFILLDSASVSAALNSEAKRFYVYVLTRPDGTPFYVGKGLGRRVFAHEAEAANTTLKTHKLNVIRAITKNGGTLQYALPHFCDDEGEAHRLEIELIKHIGRHDLKTGTLTNQTDGGEGVTGLSPETMARKAANLGGASDDPQRRVANEFFHSIDGKQDSVPIKPLGAQGLEATIPHRNARSPTDRMARVIVAAALATGKLLSAGVTFPRQFEIQGNTYVIENGVAKDMLKAGVIEVTPAFKPEAEIFTLTLKGFDAIFSSIPRDRLEDLGALEPVV